MVHNIYIFVHVTHLKYIHKDIIIQKDYKMSGEMEI